MADELTIGADGFVDMDALDDVDPELALEPDALAGLREALLGSPVPEPDAGTWASLLGDAMADDVDADLVDDLVPDQVDAGSGPFDAGIAYGDDDLDLDLDLGVGDDDPVAGFSDDDGDGDDDLGLGLDDGGAGFDAGADALDDDPFAFAPADAPDDDLDAFSMVDVGGDDLALDPDGGELSTPTSLDTHDDGGDR